MKKRILCLVCFMMVFIWVSAAYAQNKSFEKSTLIKGDYEYVVQADNTAMIVDYIGDEYILVIPDTIGGYTISAIGDYAFSSATRTKNITIGKEIKKMGRNPFLGCKLNNIEVSPQNTNFSAVKNVLFSIQGKKTLIYYATQKYQERYEIPESVICIGEYAFYSNEYLKEIIIPDTVEEIEDYAFSSCQRLEKVSIGKGIKKIGENPFFENKNLTTITVSPEHSTLALIDSVLFYKPEKNLIYYPMTLRQNKYEIPNGIKSIGDKAFYACERLESVNIPESVTQIGKGAFYSCTSLKEIIIPEGVTKIENHTFNTCIELENITLPDSITEIGEGAFSFCQGLNSVRISKGVTRIGAEAFLDCYRLSIVDIENGVEIIDDRAFKNCAIEDVTIPESVTEIGDGAFSECKKLRSINLGKEIDKIGDNPFAGDLLLMEIQIAPEHPILESINGVLFYKPDKRLVFYPIQLPDKEYEIPEGTKSIGGSAFQSCWILESVNIPESVTRIEDGAFLGCSKIEDIHIPKNVEYIGTDAFSGCRKLTLNVERDSYAKNYAENALIPYDFPDSYDWLLE